MKFFIGLLLGILIAGGTAYYLNKSPNPFVNKGFTNDTASSSPLNSSGPLILAPGTKMQPASNQNIAANNNPKPKASTPNYDFYDVLQGKKNINPKPAASQAQPTITGFLVQIGAFTNQDSANNLKAKMALLGYATRIRYQEENGKIINKVVMGPFSDINKAQSVADQLKQQAINATIVTFN